MFDSGILVFVAECIIVFSECYTKSKIQSVLSVLLSEGGSATHIQYNYPNSTTAD